MTAHPGTHRHPHWVPESRVGRWGVALGGIIVGGVLLELLAFLSGLVKPDRYTGSWPETVWGVTIWASVMVALVGLDAILRQHERSWPVRAVSVLGLAPVVLLLSEIALGKV